MVRFVVTTVVAAALLFLLVVTASVDASDDGDFTAGNVTGVVPTSAPNATDDTVNCLALDVIQCLQEQQRNGSNCRYCASIGHCTNKTLPCDCSYFTNETECRAGEYTTCAWCPNLRGTVFAQSGVCIDTVATHAVSNSSAFGGNGGRARHGLRVGCACLNLSANVNVRSCSLANESCAWCPETGLCAERRNFSGCLCGDLGTDACPNASSMCAVQHEPLIDAPRATAFCAPLEQQTCPYLTCSSLGLVNERACLNAGCHVVGELPSTSLLSHATTATSSRSDAVLYEPATCSTGVCFNFLLSGNTAMPIILMWFGFIKDCLTLLFLGRFSPLIDRFVRSNVSAAQERFAEWRASRKPHEGKKKQQRTALKNEISSNAVYVIDPICRDGANFSFSQYCEHVANTLFEVDESSYACDDNDDDDKAALDALRARHRQQLLDVIAFVTWGTGWWIYLPDILEQMQHSNSGGPHAETEIRVSVSPREGEGGGVTTPPAAIVDTEAAAAAAEAAQAAAAAVSSPSDTDDAAAEDTSSQQQMRSSEKEKKTNDNTRKSLAPLRRKFTKRQLTEHDFSYARLEERVRDKMQQHVTSLVFFATSRNSTVATVMSLNSYPSPNQVLIYVATLLVLFLSTLIQVFWTHYDFILKISKPCDADADATSSISSTSGDVSGGGDPMTAMPGNTSLLPKSNSFTRDAATLFKAGYFIVAWQLCNSSFLATAILVIVKTCRGLYHLVQDDFDTLSVPEKLPLLALYTSRRIQISLAIYVALVFPFGAWPFAFLCAKEGAGEQCTITVVPLLCGVGALLLVAAAFVVYAKFGGGHAAAALVERERYLREGGVATTENSSRNTVNAAGDDVAGSKRRTQMLSIPQESAAVGEGSTLLDNVAPAGTTRTTTAFHITQTADGLHSFVPVTAAQRAALVDSATATGATLPADVITPWQFFMRSLGEFFLREELPVIFLVFALQFSANYASMLFFARDFGLVDSPSNVLDTEWKARSMACVWDLKQQEFTRVFRSMSSFLPFL